MAPLSSSSPSALLDPAFLHFESSSPEHPSSNTTTNDTFSDDLEAWKQQDQELIRKKVENGVVILHRLPTTQADVVGGFLRSDDDNSISFAEVETPSKIIVEREAILRPEKERDMTLMESSPVRYPVSSSPPPLPPAGLLRRKRKRVDGGVSGVGKKRRIVGGFVDDDDEENEDDKEVSGVGVAQAMIEDGGDQPEPELPPMTLAPHLSTTMTGSQLSGVELLRAGREATRLVTCSGKRIVIPRRKVNEAKTIESIIAARSVTEVGKAQKSYYGIEIHQLIDEAKKQIKSDIAQRKTTAQEVPLPSIEPERPVSREGKNGMTRMWTEKYRAKRFTDLIGDERTHRQVLRWLKGWDSIVFPGTQPSSLRKKQFGSPDRVDEEKQMRKIMLLTGPPGLGKTTLAHVCAKQAGYEVLEINASDERSRDVVKGRIKDALGTENVRGINVSVEDKKIRKAGKPVCVVVDEVDGVVAGSGGSGEGGFIRALIDLVQLDQKNSGKGGNGEANGARKRKGDTFRLLRPLILICNDVYHPSLRPLRSSSIAEIVHVRKPPLDKMISRLKMVLDKEGISADNDGVRRLCETTWGIGSRKQGQANSRGSGEGDIRGILVAGEWAAHKLRSTTKAGPTRLTRKWVEEHTLNGALSGSSSGPRGLGRGGIREVVERVFLEGAGLSTLPGVPTNATISENIDTTALSVSDIRKRAAINSLREMMDTTGEHDRCITDCFSTFPTRVFQDDTFLTKPNIAYDWLQFHDSLSSRVFSSQEWELTPYLPQATLAFHNLFAAVGRNVWDSDRPAEKEEVQEEEHPFSGLRADFAAHEATKLNTALLSEFQSSFSPALMRLFRSLDSVATELLPNVLKMTAPDVKPVVVGGSAGSTASVRKEAEKQCIALGVRAMSGLGIKFDKARVELDGHGTNHGGWVYRMEPPLDELATFHMGKQNGGPPAPVRYAVRQVLDQELRKEGLRQRSDMKQARYAQGQPEDLEDEDKENIGSQKGIQQKTAIAVSAGKRDFFGRIINEVIPNGKASDVSKALATPSTGSDGKRVWVSFHEGFSNAVRKPITLKELMDSF